MKSGKNVSARGVNQSHDTKATAASSAIGPDAAALGQDRLSMVPMVSSSLAQSRQSDFATSNAVELPFNSSSTSGVDVDYDKRPPVGKKQLNTTDASQRLNQRRATYSGPPVGSVGRRTNGNSNERTHLARPSGSGGVKYRAEDRNRQRQARKAASGDQLAAARREAAARRLSSARRRERRVDERLVEVRNHIDDVHASVVQSLHDAVVSAIQHYSQSIQPQHTRTTPSSAFSTSTTSATRTNTNNSSPHHNRHQFYQQTNTTNPRGFNRHLP